MTGEIVEGIALPMHFSVQVNDTKHTSDDLLVNCAPNSDRLMTTTPQLGHSSGYLHVASRSPHPPLSFFSRKPTMPMHVPFIRIGIGQIRREG